MKFIIGLLCGIAIACGVAYYLNQAPNPFTNKKITDSTPLNNSSSSPLILAPSTKMQAATNQDDTTIQINDNKPEASAPNYDFYDVLQGKKNIDPHQEGSSPKAKLHGFIIQVGAFVTPDLANDLKARLALLGYAVKIRPHEENGKIINKLIMGPFASYDQAREILDQLKQQDINGTIINLNSQ